MVNQLKVYLLQTDFEKEARYIADQVNGSTPDLRTERAELATINAQLNNGLKAILNGMDIPELRDEMDKLRVRKGELEDIIGRRTARRKPVDPQDIVRLFQKAVENWDTDLPMIIKQHVGKIYAHTDGSCSVSVGVHLNGASGDIGFTPKASNINGLRAIEQQYLHQNQISSLDFEGVPVMERLFSCPKTG